MLIKQQQRSSAMDFLKTFCGVSRKLMRRSCASGAFIALVFPVALLAQETSSQKPMHHRYRVVVLGTDGGSDSYLAGYLFYAPLTEHDTVGVAGDTNIPGNYNSYTWTHGVQTDLQALPEQAGSPPNGTYINWINQWGLAVGYASNGIQDPIAQETETKAVIWAPNGQIYPLETLGGYQSQAIWVNELGQVSGWLENTTPDPYSMGAGAETTGFIWQFGILQTLGTLGGPDSVGKFINDLGQVSGHSYTGYTPNEVTGVPPIDPFIWEDGKMTDINPGNFGGAQGGTNYLNNAGQVVGFGTVPGEAGAHPFLWQKGKLTDLFLVGNLGGNLNSAYNVNERGDVVGIAALSDNSAFHAVLWRHDGVFTDLKTLAGDTCAQPYRINSHNQIVGFSGSCDFSTQHAFLWEDGEMVDLETLIPSDSGIELATANWITERGEIAAQATLTTGGAYRAVLLIPDGDCDGDCAARVAARHDEQRPAPMSTNTEATVGVESIVMGNPTRSSRPSLWRPFLASRPHPQS
jgi:probable HAF family extracellular repeat protein